MNPEVIAHIRHQCRIALLSDLFRTFALDELNDHGEADEIQLSASVHGDVAELSMTYLVKGQPVAAGSL